MSTHRKIQRSAVSAGVVGAAGAAMITLAHPAAAAPADVWDRLAACESSGNWQINTGNGYYGGLQFSSGTWAAYKPAGAPALASQATKAQQIAGAVRVLAAQGPGAWPVCSVKAGLSRGASAPVAKAAPVVKAQPASGNATAAVAYALSKVGSSYSWGATGPRSFDCSGLTSAAWRSVGVSIPRTADAQWKGLPRVSLKSLRPGDLIPFGYGAGYANHVAIYVGNGMIVDTSSHRPGGGVGKQSLSSRAGSGGWHALGAVRPQGSTYTPPAPEVTPKASPAPERTAQARPAPAQAKPVTGAPGTHTVVPGDTLSDIARVWGVPGGWPALYEINRDVVGSDPDLIFPQQVLRLK